jgi:hypothetical protein
MLISDCSALFDQRNGDFLIVGELGKKSLYAEQS